MDLPDGFLVRPSHRRAQRMRTNTTTDGLVIDIIGIIDRVVSHTVNKQDVSRPRRSGREKAHSLMREGMAAV
jgi:hypothetical protein